MQKLTIVALLFVSTLCMMILGYIINNLDIKTTMEKSFPNTEIEKTEPKTTISHTKPEEENIEEVGIVEIDTEETVTNTTNIGSATSATGSSATGTHLTESGSIVDIDTSATGEILTPPSIDQEEVKEEEEVVSTATIEAEKVALNTYLKNKDYKQAAFTYDKLLQIDPHNIDLHREGTKNYILKIKDYPKALEYTKTFVDNNTRSAIANNAYGWALIKNNQLDIAKEVLLVARELNNQIPEIFLNLGDIERTE
ncbi:MAG: hypothetical protein U9Q15_00415 [Patescibacteria group bacterium]|nr:hypothetical protein [Patescibacteria group bacterium]